MAAVGWIMSQSNEIHTNALRRTFGVILCTLPLTLAAASIAAGVFSHAPLFRGISFITVAMMIAILNFYLSFGRPIINSFMNSPQVAYHYVSGLPVVGTTLVIVGLLFGFGAIGTATLAAFATALDTGGSVWFLLATWKDTTFWDS